MSNSQNENYKIYTLSLIQNDCETLKKIMYQSNDSIFWMELVTYMALFCRSLQEYYDIPMISEEIDSEIYDIRNSIKLYGERYGKSKKQFLESDEIQDEEFRNMLRFDWSKERNIHYNLGIYFTEDRKVIGNTQLIANTLSLNGVYGRERSEKSQMLGYYLRRIICRASDVLAGFATAPCIELLDSMPVFYYKDMNTNREWDSIFSASVDKDANLFMLHILCSINYVKYVLEPLFPNENVWLFRIKYITVYHAYMGMKRLKATMENNQTSMAVLIESLGSILENGEGLFTSKFRNCMMHYNLEKDGVFAISDDNFNEKKLFYGLIEECFQGESYESYYAKISCLGSQIEDFLTGQFKFDDIYLRKL